MVIVINIHVTWFQNHDWEIFASIIEQTFSIEINFPYYQTIQNRNVKGLGIYFNDRFICGLFIREESALLEPIKIWRLDYICIDPDYQNKKYGQLLIKKLEHLARENNIQKITFTSNSKRVEANHLYQKHNYQKRDTNLYEKIL